MVAPTFVINTCSRDLPTTAVITITARGGAKKNVNAPDRYVVCGVLAAVRLQNEREEKNRTPLAAGGLGTAENTR